MSTTANVSPRTNPTPRLGTSPQHVVTLIRRGLLVLTGAAGAFIATLTPAAAPGLELLAGRVINHTEPFLNVPLRHRSDLDTW